MLIPYADNARGAGAATARRPPLGPHTQQQHPPYSKNLLRLLECKQPDLSRVSTGQAGGMSIAPLHLHTTPSLTTCADVSLLHAVTRHTPASGRPPAAGGLAHSHTHMASELALDQSGALPGDLGLSGQCKFGRLAVGTAVKMMVPLLLYRAAEAMQGMWLKPSKPVHLVCCAAAWWCVLASGPPWLLLCSSLTHRYGAQQGPSPLLF